jgi:hypothetical protein
MIKDEDKQTTGANKSVLEQINSLKREDERLYNILAIDVWALAKTMDEYQPGFLGGFYEKSRESSKAISRGNDEKQTRRHQTSPFPALKFW